MNKFTVIGGKGFIGSHLMESLHKMKYEVSSLTRDEVDEISRDGKTDLGHVIYCIGLTSNFRKHPFRTVDAHVCILNGLLRKSTFESLIYLSSTRVYQGGLSTNENAALQANPNNPGDLYNLSKLLGESLCLGAVSNARVVRLSNVYGVDSSESFLDQVLNEAVKSRHVVFKTSPESTKDFVSIDDVVDLLPKIALHGKEKIYNIASGINTSNIEIANALSSLGYSFSFDEDSPTWSFAKVNVQKLKQEFNYEPLNLINEIDLLLKQYS